MGKNYKILAINPGSTSTKVSVFENEDRLISVTIRHSTEEIGRFADIYDQYEFRRDVILQKLDEKGLDLKTLDAIVARGGNMKPVAGGTYLVNEEMLDDLKSGERGKHASNLGAIIADAVARPFFIPSYVVDPVVVDEMEPLARISGAPEIERKPKDHPLNQKAVGRAAAKELGGRYEDFNFLIAHMGGGVSIGVHQKGRIIDVNNCLDGEGPMSPERCGGIPFGSLIEICYSGRYTKEELQKRLVGKSGLAGYLGTSDAREVEKRVRAGDQAARIIYEAMAYQISKEIAAGSAVLKGEVDAILLTGGLAFDSMFVDWIRERVSFIAPILVFPGEHELEAMVSGVLRVLRKEEELKTYPNPCPV